MKQSMKFFAASLASFAICISSFAETKTAPMGYEFHLKASRGGSEYKCGEVAEFVLTAAQDGEASCADGLKVTGSITKDSVDIGKNFSGKIENGKFVVKATLDEPGFLKCNMFIKTFDKNGKSVTTDLVAGAGFNVLDIKPSMPAPDDFDAYWDKQKKILAAIPMNVKLTKLDLKGVKGMDEVDLFDVQADTFGGKLSAYMAIPKGAKPKSLPAVVFAHGAGVRSSSLSVIGWAQRGFIALDFNAHGLPNGKSAQFYADLKNGELNGYPLKNCEDRDTIFFRTLYMRLMRAMDVICAQPQWDGKNLAVCGGSQGGGQALAAGGLNPKVTVVAAMFPAICDHSGAAIGRTTGWPHFTRVAKDGSYNKKAVEAARYIDAVNFAARIKGKVVMMINYADTTCEPTTCYAAYNNIKTEKKLWINEESRHTPAAGTYAAAQNMMVDFLRAAGADVKHREKTTSLY